MNLSGCVTARIEDNRIGNTGISEGEGIVILPKSYHLGNDTETDFIVGTWKMNQYELSERHSCAQLS